jgi:hypothetical protein
MKKYRTVNQVKNLFKIHLFLLYCQLNNQNQSTSNSRVILTYVPSTLMIRLRKAGIFERGISAKDEPLSCFALERIRPILPMGQDHGINNLTAPEAPPTIEMKHARIVSEILKRLMDHTTGTTRAFHRRSPLAFQICNKVFHK